MNGAASRWTERSAALTVLALALLPCPATAWTDSQPAPPGALVDIGGYRLHLHCAGQGSPTVILEAGAGDFSFDWSLVQPALAGRTRVCSYDRAGYAWSDSGPGPRTVGQVVAELRALLAKGGLNGPHVLVGHSLGGLFVRAFAMEHPADVRGVVLIEATHEDNPIMLNGQLVLLRSTSRGREIPRPRLEPPARESAPIGGPSQASPPPTLRSPYDRLPEAVQRLRIWAMQRPSFSQAGAGEFDYLPEDVSRIHEQRARDGVLLRDLPLVVLTRKGAPTGHAARQADLARLSTNSKVIVASTEDHHIQLTDPGAVVGAVNEVLQAARNSSRLDQRP